MKQKRGDDDSSAASQLEHLLTDLFNERELRRFIYYLPGGNQMSRQLPGPSATLEEYAHEAVKLLHRQGRVDEHLFQALREARPKRAAEIEALAWLVRGGRPLIAAKSGIPAAARVVLRASHLFDLASLFLPVRVANEELGDALEDIHRRVERGCLAWKIYLRAITAILWATWNAITGWRPARDKRGA